MEEKIRTLHPQDKQGVNIARKKYDAVRQAILNVLQKGERTHTELYEGVKQQLFGTFDGSIGWYTESVKLDLEARHEIERTEQKPATYRIKAPVS